MIAPLLPLSWLYASALVLRNLLFDRGVLKSERAGVPVLSVGNMTVGGTGKTPLVEYIVRHLLSMGKRVGVVSRGYKRTSRGVVVVSDGRRVFVGAAEGGDEPVQIATKFREAIVVVGEKRIEAARRAVTLGAEVLVADDAFQHRQLHRECDIVVVDATRDIGSDAVLPAGRLREPLSGLRRADVVALSHVNAAAVPEAVSDAIRRYYAKATVTFRYGVRDARRAKDDGRASLDVIRRMKLFAFSGIGKHEAFVDQLQNNGFGIVGSLGFADHHPFTERDAELLGIYAKALEADGFITTEKDVARLRSVPALMQQLDAQLPIFYIVIDVEILGGKEFLHHCIEQTLRGGQQQ